MGFNIPNNIVGKGEKTNHVTIKKSSNCLNFILTLFIILIVVIIFRKIISFYDTPNEMAPATTTLHISSTIQRTMVIFWHHDAKSNEIIADNSESEIEFPKAAWWLELSDQIYTLKIRREARGLNSDLGFLLKPDEELDSKMGPFIIGGITKMLSVRDTFAMSAKEWKEFAFIIYSALRVTDETSVEDMDSSSTPDENETDEPFEQILASKEKISVEQGDLDESHVSIVLVGITNFVLPDSDEQGIEGDDDSLIEPATESDAKVTDDNVSFENLTSDVWVEYTANIYLIKLHLEQIGEDPDVSKFWGPSGIDVDEFGPFVIGGKVMKLTFTDSLKLSSEEWLQFAQKVYKSLKLEEENTDIESSYSVEFQVTSTEKENTSDEDDLEKFLSDLLTESDDMNLSTVTQKDDSREDAQMFFISELNEMASAIVAKSKCVLLKMELVNIANSEDLYIVNEFLKGQTDTFWTSGLMNIDNESFKWDNGGIFGDSLGVERNTKNTKDFPNNCIALSPSASEYKLNGVPCRRRHRYICKQI